MRIIQGCIVMLVAMLNGDDPVASRYAGKLLNTLSSNTQNALHMAEAGLLQATSAVPKGR
ncbi:hypothetical protein FH972_010652 [Carpinus fangiana]|uniref:Uncharacterized protein n=1 Tax=Carpinus fangiana TaxID=176857 RepID=A0A660KQZ3_9ROSI|nr:hypothetical protein FH972_010652 [Carpinus fangiana]